MTVHDLLQYGHGNGNRTKQQQCADCTGGSCEDCLEGKANDEE